MIISNLKNIVNEWNRANEKYEDVKPITSIYELYKRMKGSNLKISRPILTRLWNDTLSKHITDKGDVYNEAHGIKFDTLNRLVKFFDKPAGAFFSYVVGIKTSITIQRLTKFIKNNPQTFKKMNKIWPINNVKDGDSILRINYFNREHEKQPRSYLLIVQPSFITSGISNEYTFVNMRYTNVYSLTNNKLDEITRDDIIRTSLSEDSKTLNKLEHKYLNTILMRNSFLSNPKGSIMRLFYTGTFGTKDDIKNRYDYRYYKFDVLDDLGSMRITSDDVKYPQRLLEKDKNTDGRYNFAFKDLK